VKPTEAAKLLGGYATGTLSEAERQRLFAAALERQELFDALMDEEALRELLAGPGAKAQLMEALAQAGPPKVAPFWRRPGLLGAAAGLIVAATASLAYLRSPEKVPPPLQDLAKPLPAEAPAVPTAPQATQAQAKLKAPAAPRKETAQPSPVVEATPPPAPAPKPLAPPAATAGAPVLAREDAARMNVQAASRQAEAEDRMAKKAEAPRSVGALMEATGSVVPTPAVPKAVASRRDGTNLGGALAIPTWTLDTLSDGSTQVTVMAPPGTQALLLKRPATGVEVTKLFMVDGLKDGATRWQGKVRLAEGDVLDLYVLNAPVADPAKLPETGPVNGYRVRIHPATRH